ncbi:MAG TPA: DUF4215 domain-containing protein, partial [Kofleriaceae bacterium]|nr:DUF4215 domain-containing protein [Kofleriaceae bacterium]
MKFSRWSSIVFVFACGGSSTPSSPDARGSDAAIVTPDAAVVGCGDGKLGGAEVCDDGNTAANDGCSADCTQIENGYVCTQPGMACVIPHTCGNGIVETTEGCDDRNVTAGDGCSTACALEAGWACPVPGIRCTAALCGDGIVAGFETCDDGAPGSGDGCSAACHVEPGFACATPNAPCATTTCGDGVREGLEECDDDNSDLGDGCDPLCKREPTCVAGVCAAVCGDGVVQPGEGCDDGNLFAADGCSPTCSAETGFTCTASSITEPASLPVTIVYRDFRGFDLAGGHPDFEHFNGAETGIVTADLGPDHKPVYAGNPRTATTNGAAAFSTWYRDDP